MTGLELDRPEDVELLVGEAKDEDCDEDEDEMVTGRCKGQHRSGWRGKGLIAAVVKERRLTTQSQMY